LRLQKSKKSTAHEGSAAAHGETTDAQNRAMDEL
jgi:hypothetical protein